MIIFLACLAAVTIWALSRISRTPTERMVERLDVATEIHCEFVVQVLITYHEIEAAEDPIGEARMARKCLEMQMEIGDGV